VEDNGLASPILEMGRAANPNAPCVLIFYLTPILTNKFDGLASNKKGLPKKAVVVCGG